MPLFAPVTQHPGFISGRSYALIVPSGVTATAVSAIDTIYFHPVVLLRPISFTNGTMRVTTGGAASSTKAGIWANSPVSNRPLGAPLYKDNTGVATTSSNVNVTVALGAGVLSPGFYWWGSKYTGTLPQMSMMTSSETSFAYFHGIPSGTAVNLSGLALADTYSNNMPTIAEGASFTIPGAPTPLGFLTAT